MAKTSWQIQHPLMFGNTHVLRHLIKQYGVERGLRQKATTMLIGSIATAPLRAYERATYATREQQPITQPPVFILGHWRGGTTQLHYLMAQDPQFGYITTFQMFMPDMMFIGDTWIKPLLQRFTPATRPIDNLPMGMNLAQEEEYALAARSPHSFYHQWVFPRAFRTLRTNYMLLEGDEASNQAWQRDYRLLMQKIASYWQGKSLLIKNPTNTARIKALLAMFPNAKFINIVRDPYRIFLSTRHLYRVSNTVASLHAINDEFMQHMILENYQVMMQQYLAQRSLIPASRFVEVRFEDLERDPWAVIRTIYEALDLHGLDHAHPAMQRYLDSLGTYRKNALTMDAGLARTVEQAWGFAFDAWNYSRINN